MRAQLLSSKTINSLIHAESIEKLSELLFKTPYREDFEKIGKAKIDALTLERIFYQKFIERLNRITSVAPAEIADFFRSYFFMKLEIQNLKRIFRGKLSRISANKIKRVLIPLNQISPINFDFLAEAENLRAATDLLKNTIYSFIIESVNLCEANDVLWPIELKLNNVHAQAALRHLSKLPQENRETLKQIIEVEVNVENLLLAITLKKSSKLPFTEDIFHFTSKISKETLEKTIAGKDFKEFVKSSKFPYSNIIEPIVYGEEALVRTKLRKYILNEVSKNKVVDDFGFTSIMSYLISCEIERDDLGSIAWGIENKVKVERILKYVASMP